MIADTQVTAPPHYAGDGTIECHRAQLYMASGYDRAACPSGMASYESYLDGLANRITLMANKYGIADRQPRLF